MSGQDDPDAADAGISIWAPQLEIDDITLSVGVRIAEHGFGILGGSQQGYSEVLSVSFPDSGGREYAGFVAASRMVRVQAVSAKLLNIDDGKRSVRQLHESPMVTIESVRWIKIRRVLAWTPACA